MQPFYCDAELLAGDLVPIRLAVNLAPHELDDIALRGRYDQGGQREEFAVVLVGNVLRAYFDRAPVEEERIPVIVCQLDLDVGDDPFLHPVAGPEQILNAARPVRGAVGSEERTSDLQSR